MSGTRADAVVDEPTVLQFEFRKNGSLYNADEIIGVEIYPSFADAEAGTNIIETIDPVDITNPSVGVYEYTAAAIDTAGTYYDKMRLKAEVGQDEWTHPTQINPFYVRLETYGGSAPGAIEKARVVLYVKDIFDEAATEDVPTMKINREWAWYGKQQIRRIEHEPVEQDDDGRFVFDIIETETMTADTGADVYYILTVGRFEYKFTVPKGTIDKYLKDLPEYTEE